MKQYLFSHRRAAVRALVAGLAMGALSGTSAQAALITTDACDGATLSQPFLSKSDSSYYKLVPGGQFDGPSDWTYSGGAHVVTGGPDGAGAFSLYLPAGASAQSPFTCVDAAYPSFRFYALNRSLLSTLLVQVVYTEPLVGQVAVPVGAVALSGSWNPSLPMLTASAIPAALSGGISNVALRFTALTGPSQIANVFVDPRMH